MALTLEELVDKGAKDAEQAVLDSEALDYAFLQGRDFLDEMIKNLATRGKPNGNANRSRTGEGVEAEGGDDAGAPEGGGDSGT